MPAAQRQLRYDRWLRVVYDENTVGYAWWDRWLRVVQNTKLFLRHRHKYDFRFAFDNRVRQFI